MDQWRRRTGIEPAERGSLVPTVLKTAEPTRYSYASVAKAISPRLASDRVRFTTSFMTWLLVVLSSRMVLLSSSNESAQRAK